jgi:pimeloyl-ACP methyl ester carboxylesterase
MPRISASTEHESIHYTDHGTGQPVVLIHGWPLSGRSWEAQVPALVGAGYRVIAYDRRGFGDSSQPWDGYDYDTFADDLAALIDQLDLTDVVLVGFSMGGGEIARYIGRHGSARLAKVVFAGAVPPNLHKTADNPDGALDDATIEQFQEAVRTDRIAFLHDFMRNFFSANGELKVSEAQVQYAVDLASWASPKGTLDCIAAFGTTDFREDLTKVDVPALVIHGNADAIVPFEASGRRTADAVTGARLHVIEGGPHGTNVSHATEFNEALLGFLRS